MINLIKQGDFQHDEVGRWGDLLESDECKDLGEEGFGR